MVSISSTTLVLVTFLSGFVVQAKNNKDTIEKIDAFTLVKADNKPIESLAALRSGVYSLALAQGVRSGCGGGNSSPGDQGMHLDNIIVLWVDQADKYNLISYDLMQSSWDLTIVLVVHHCLPSPLLGQ